MVIFCFGSKKPPSVQAVLRYSRPNLLAVSLPSPAFITCAPNQNRHAMQAINILSYFTGPPQQWEDVFLLLTYTGMQSIFFFQKTNALIALWENRLIKYYLLFNRGYVVLISVQPWPEIEELSFQVLVLKVLFAFHWFRMSEKRNRVIIR